jgi:hypothetical protein
VETERLQDGKAGFSRLAGKIDPKQSPAVPEQFGKFGRGNILSYRLASGEKEGADHGFPCCVNFSEN